MELMDFCNKNSLSGIPLIVSLLIALNCKLGFESILQEMKRSLCSTRFAEYCILGWENFPRSLILYYTNFVSSPEGYFQTLICNSKQYINTTINHDLHYITWDTPPRQHPRFLSLRDYKKMVATAPFARKFKENDLDLDKIDREILKRHYGQFSYGGWCGGKGGLDERCSHFQAENYGSLKPGSGPKRLKEFANKFTEATSTMQMTDLLV